MIRQRYIERIQLSLMSVTESELRVKSSQKSRRKQNKHLEGKGNDQFESMVNEQDYDDANSLLFSSMNLDRAIVVKLGNSTIHIEPMSQSYGKFMF